MGESSNIRPVQAILTHVEQNFVVVMISPILINRIQWKGYLIFMAIAVYDESHGGA